MSDSLVPSPLLVDLWLKQGRDGKLSFEEFSAMVASTDIVKYV